VKLTVETVYQIWNDDDGTRLEVGPDRDGLDMIEIRRHTEDGKICDRIAMPRDEAIHLRDCLDKILRKQQEQFGPVPR
jgi:hypothetical protein